jgi:hypothetical protein
MFFPWRWNVGVAGCGMEHGSYSRMVLVDEGRPVGLVEELEVQKTEGGMEGEERKGKERKGKERGGEGAFFGGWG